MALEAPALPPPARRRAAGGGQNNGHAPEQQQLKKKKKKRKLEAAAAAADDDAPQAAAPAAEQPPAAAEQAAAAADVDERDNPPARKQKKQKGPGGMEVERHTTTVSGIMSQQTFEQLDLTEQTKKGIGEMGFSHMTEVQARTIPQLLVGRDVLGAAKTGAHAALVAGGAGGLAGRCAAAGCSGPWRLRCMLSKQ